jgi:hypothetical protein
VKLAILGQALDGGDPLALSLHRQCQARGNRFAIHEHSAGPTLPLIATLLGSGKTQALSQDLEQGPVRLYCHLIEFVVYV